MLQNVFNYNNDDDDNNNNNNSDDNDNSHDNNDKSGLIVHSHIKMNYKGPIIKTSSRF